MGLRFTLKTSYSLIMLYSYAYFFYTYLQYERGTFFRASYSKLGSKLTLHTLDTHILPYDLLFLYLTNYLGILICMLLTWNERMNRDWNVKRPSSHQSSEEPLIFSNIVQLWNLCFCFFIIT